MAFSWDHWLVTTSVQRRYKLMPVPNYVSNLSGLEALHYDFLYIHVILLKEGLHARNKSPSYIHFREQESRYARVFYNTYEICTSSPRMSTQSVVLCMIRSTCRPISKFSNFGRLVSRRYYYVYLYVLYLYCILASLQNALTT